MPAKRTRQTRANMGEFTRVGKRGQTAIIFIDPWYGRWLKVGGSGLKWHNYPLAHGRQLSAPKILRRRIPSRPRRQTPYHHPFTVARRRRRGLHYPARTAAAIPSYHVPGG